MRYWMMLCLSILMTLPAAAQDTATVITPPDGSQYEWVEVSSGFERPLFVTGANDGRDRLFIVEQGGMIYAIEDGEMSDFMDATVLVSRNANERGLLGLAFHPDFATNGTFFINYTDSNGDTVVARYQVTSDGNQADMDSGAFIIRIGQPYPNHNGGDIAFGPDGYLYVGMGDGGSAGDPQGYGQNPQSLLGKMLRLDVDNGSPYAIPTDNPYATVNDQLAPEIWSWGLRNPWRFSFDRATGDLYIADVGQNQWEEVNFQPAASPGGENYGWNIMEGSQRYSGEPVIDGLVNPFAEYNHGQGCSVTGGYVYRGAALPDLQGVYFFGDYCSGIIWASYRDAAGEWQTNVFMDTNLTISSFGLDDAGELYLVNHGGNVLQLVANN